MARLVWRIWQVEVVILVLASALISLTPSGGYAETVSIGDGTEPIELLDARPLATSLRQLHVQIVYLAGETRTGGKILSLAFEGQFGGSAEATKWTIRMKHTDLPGFRKRWVRDLGYWAEVYEGPQPGGRETGRLKFDLDRDFEYDGVHNVMIDIEIEDIAPRDEIAMIGFQADWPRTAYKVIGLLPSLPPSRDPADLAGDFRLTRWVPNVTMEIEPPETPSEPAAAFPFFEGFETGTLPGYWETYEHSYVGDIEAQLIEVTRHCGPHSGTYHLRMDVDGSGDSFVNAVILTIDLLGQQNVVLEFWHKWFDYVHNRQLGCQRGVELPATTPANAIAISDNGEDWVGVLGLQPRLTVEGFQTYLQYFVDLDEVAEQAGMSFNSHFKIKFQHGLTYFACLPPASSRAGCPHPCNLDPGVTFDDISIKAGNPPPTITGITPSSGDNGGTVEITELTGTGFIHGAGVRLIREGQPDIMARDCVVYGTDRITCELPLDEAAIGPWDVVVTNMVDALSGTLRGGFEVTDASIEVITVGDLDDDDVYTQIPMGTHNYCQRAQVIYPADEIGRAGTIIEVALDVRLAPRHGLTDWTIRMQHTTLSSFPEQAEWEADGWTVCHQSLAPRGEVGWRTFPLVTPFEYNGRDNLMIDFSFSNQERSSSGDCWASLTGDVMAIGHGKDFSPCEENPKAWNGRTPEPNRFSARPDIRLTFVRQ